MKEHLFADIFGRDILTFQQRELATISGAGVQLQAHIGMGMNTGITEEQLKQTFVLVGSSIGKKEGDNAAAILRQVITGRQ